jgi:hypothetical protein
MARLTVRSQQRLSTSFIGAKTRSSSLAVRLFQAPRQDDFAVPESTRQKLYRRPDLALSKLIS